MTEELKSETEMRAGFDAQRKVGMNVDWFTWQIAWHDALFTMHDIASAPVEVPFVDSYGFEVLLGDRMYIDNSMQYRNGTTVLTIKRKPCEIEAAPTGDDTDMPRKE